jgi:hypothetical protein
VVPVGGFSSSFYAVTNYKKKKNPKRALFGVVFFFPFLFFPIWPVGQPKKTDKVKQMKKK